MMSHLENPLSSLRPQNKGSDVLSGGCISGQDCLPGDNEAEFQPPSDVKDDGDFPSDDDDEMLKYAIMLSLQTITEDDSTSSSNNRLNTERAASHEHRSTIPPPLSLRHSTIMQSSGLTDLPLELKEMICLYVLSGNTIVVKPSKAFPAKFLITWGQHLSILLVSREFNSIATRYLASGEVVLDLRQFHTRNNTVGRNSTLTLTLENLLCNATNLASVCSKLMIRQGQSFDCDDLEFLLPALTNVELYDYKSCREILRESGLYSGGMFEYEVPMKTRSHATDQLKDFQDSLPPSVCADLIYVCDTLVCIPQYEDEILHTGNGKSKGVENVMARVKNAVRGGGQTRSETTSQEMAQQNPRYKTAKMRHLVLFNRFNPEGVWLSKEWVVAGLGVQSLSLGDIIAIHCHEYCLELIERGETVGV